MKTAEFQAILDKAAMPSKEVATGRTKGKLHEVELTAGPFAGNKLWVDPAIKAAAVELAS